MTHLTVVVESWGGGGEGPSARGHAYMSTSPGGPALNGPGTGFWVASLETWYVDTNAINAEIISTATDVLVPSEFANAPSSTTLLGGAV